jgi:hypothetical protein
MKKDCQTEKTPSGLIQVHFNSNEAAVTLKALSSLPLAMSDPFYSSASSVFSKIRNEVTRMIEAEKNKTPESEGA